MFRSKQKARINQRFALALVLLLLLASSLTLLPLQAQKPVLFYGLLLAFGLGALLLYRALTRKHRERAQLAKQAFPENWRQTLERDVVFYQSLTDEDRQRFETEVQIFLHETRVTGVKTEVDDRSLVLVAASAVIPIFGFPNWSYENLGEVLLYPTAFNRYFQTEGEQRQIWGMVGTGYMTGTMALSKPALIAGFENSRDKKNTGIHEFVHLLDASDGIYDGVPETFLENQYLEPWLEVMHQEMGRIESGESSMNPYGGTAKVEFFAVASEFFFERPALMERQKPELYKLLSQVFQQNPKQRLSMAFKDMLNYKGKKISRNAACPCKSGKKYKHCCLSNARQY